MGVPRSVGPMLYLPRRNSCSIHMRARLLDGKAVAEQIRGEIRLDVERLRGLDIIPGLAAVLVGETPASASYVASKAKACREVGISSRVIPLKTEVSQEELLGVIRALNVDPHVHGILVQLPLPANLPEGLVLETVAPTKDVDGFHPVNVGRILSGRGGFAPATPLGVVELLHRTDHPPRGKHVVILGRSNIVGKPLASLLIQRGEDATVTLCHSKTERLEEITRTADILVAAIGSPRFVSERHVKEGAIVVDVGINRIDDPGAPKGYRLVGDVDFERVKEVADAISPVPGGVGPMTVAMLLQNTVAAASAVSPVPNPK